ncbi:MAG: hypothetical protein ACE5IZ_03700 [Dehalococcoidia bacterium]
MAADEREKQVLSQLLESGEEVLATGLAETGPVGFLWEVLMSLTLGLLRLALVRNWRLAITDRRIVLFRRVLSQPSAPWEERPFRYDQLARAEVRGGGLYRVVRLWTAEGERIQLRLPYLRNDVKALEQALRQAAPELIVS